VALPRPSYDNDDGAGSAAASAGVDVGRGPAERAADTGIVVARSSLAPSEARRFADGVLGRWGVTEGRAPLLLVVSELVTNAVTHGRGPVELSLALDSSSVRIEVRDDGGDGSPALGPLDAGPGRLGGRGLRMVEAVTDAWGSERLAAGGTLVWARRSVTAPEGP
jgi:anti-sigma regulatory factor (Ser/Thr protein kinase)